MRKSKGMGDGVLSIDSELRTRDRPYRFISEGTSNCVRPSGSCKSGDVVVKLTLICWGSRAPGWGMDVSMPLLCLLLCRELQNRNPLEFI